VLEVELVLGMKLPLALVGVVSEASNAVVLKKETPLLFDVSIGVKAMFVSTGSVLVGTVVVFEVTETISVMVVFTWFVFVGNIVVGEETATVSGHSGHAPQIFQVHFMSQDRLPELHQLWHCFWFDVKLGLAETRRETALRVVIGNTGKTKTQCL